MSKLLAVALLIIGGTLCSCLQAHSTTASTGPILAPPINTTTGRFTGLFDKEFNVNKYKGVPFAAPPKGKLRFMPTQPGEYMGDVNAFEFGPGCFQDCTGFGSAHPNQFNNFSCTPVVSEDCLFLNVFVPANWTQEGKGDAPLLPVIFFIHGGSFYWGSGGTEIYDGTEWAGRENVIVVTINYRLNVFGALSTKFIQGNFQLQDQRFAMKWVQDNIAEFGGNPQKVLISGESAGAMSIGMHLASPEAWPLFQSAAVISDPYALGPWDRATAERISEHFIGLVGCDNSTDANETEVIECMQQVPAETILLAAYSPEIVTKDGVIWNTNIDGKILPMQPIEASKKGLIADVPLYIGNCANESAPFLYGTIPPLTETDLFYYLTTNLGGEKNAQELINLYGPFSANQKSDSLGMLARMQTDYLFYCPTRRTALNAYQSPFGRKSDIYMYFYDIVPSWTRWWAGGSNPTNPYWKACSELVCHAWDLPFIFFSTRYLPAEAQPTAEEVTLIQFMQSAWAQIAGQGKMNADMGWPTFNNRTLHAYNLSVPLPTTPVSAYRAEYCDWWDSYGYEHFKNLPNGTA